MAGFRDIDKALFPLKSISSVIQIFKNQLSSDREPDLALLSIIAGAVENSLTCRSNTALQVYEPVEPQSLPVLELHTVETLYSKFHSVMKSAVEVPKTKPKFATRALVKKVSMKRWCNILQEDLFFTYISLLLLNRNVFFSYKMHLYEKQI